jgi:hypothetical protein
MKAQPEIVRRNDLKPETCNPEPASPCANICVMDDKRGLCRGCARTLDEIANWPSYARAEKLAVLEQVARRKAAAALANRSALPTHRS